MAISEFKAALNQVATERGIPPEEVIASIQSALLAAYIRDQGGEKEDIEVVVNEDTGEAKIMQGDEDVTPAGFGRIAAQTAKQVVLQKIRETEKQIIFDEFEDKVGTLINGIIFRIESGRIILDLGKAHGTLPQSEQVDNESYRVNQRLKVYIKDVRKGPRGTEIIVSRADAELVKKLFEQEVPEIATGTVEIKAIAREAGSRTKMAVSSTDEKIDPVGSCVGQKGVRVQAIISELYGEKIDIIPYSPQIEKFIAASLSPARVTDVSIDEEEHKATVSVPEDQQSLAIGKEGQNARLANKLTRWKIDIKGTKGIFDMDMSTESSSTTTSDKTVGVWDAAIAKVNADAGGAPEEDDEDEKDVENAVEENIDTTEDIISEEVPAETTEEVDSNQETDETSEEEEATEEDK